jgi:hypothetical protein
MTMRRLSDLGQTCSCSTKELSVLPPAVRQLRGSLSLLVCAACGGLRAK